jgi:hypothetical protein
LLSNWLFARFSEIPFSLPIPEAWAQKLPWLSRPENVEGGE